MMNHLELFSGTHSFGKVSHKLGYNVVSLDRDLGASCPFTDYVSKTHIQEDIMTWDYKQYPVGHFSLITASPVCLWWSRLRNSWIGRKCKTIHPTDVITKDHIQNDINQYGKPMVDKVIEIIQYFKPKYWVIENPMGSRMKEYMTEEYPQYNTYNNFSYCKFSDWGYQKNTRFWNNIPGLQDNICKKLNYCDTIVTEDGNARHKKILANGYEMIDSKKVLCNTKELRTKLREQKKKEGATKMPSTTNGTKKIDRYRIPENLIEYILNDLQ